MYINVTTHCGEYHVHACSSTCVHVYMATLNVSTVYVILRVQCILELRSLSMLYLHGNNIGRIAEVDKLSILDRLKSLTLHGNHIESNAGYRQYIICRLPQLQTFDFSGVTKSDRATAQTWRTMIAPSAKKSTKKKAADK